MGGWHREMWVGYDQALVDCNIKRAACGQLLTGLHLGHCAKNTPALLFLGCFS